MFVSRIQIKNFRNFHDFDVALGSTSVIVGENGVGKSNLLFALRLILDPRLPDSSRYLRREDFWDGLKEPVKDEEVIEVSIEFQDFQKDVSVFAVLQSYCIPGSGPATARLTYRFRPISPLPKNRDLTIEDYEFILFGGVNEGQTIDYQFRRWIPIEVLRALRDAERDLSTWRQSPLRPLVENLSISDATLESVATGIDQATDQLLAEKDVNRLIRDIRSRLANMVGSILEIEPTLGFTPTIPERLTRELRMFGDGVKKRSVGELSLGIDNVLYLLLLTLELDRKEEAKERAKTIIAIEEPEAHLHPHLQRLVFRDFLRRESPVLLTTHSPHIASVAPLSSVVLLKNDADGDGSKGTSILKAGLDSQEVSDIERYLDTTRAEVLFARGVIFVEGPSELFLIPAVAESMGHALDEYGITVCSVHGTDFLPYAKLVGPRGLDIPFVILTDGDWRKNKNGVLVSQGLRRAVRVAKAIGHPDSRNMTRMLRSQKWGDLHTAARNVGIFVGDSTLEVDLFASGHGSEVVDTLRELGVAAKRAEVLESLADQEANLSRDDAKYLLRSIERFGKGRVAQRFAAKVDSDRIPTYIKDGVLRIVEVLTQ